MKKISTILKKMTVCLFATVCVSANVFMVANATEIEAIDNTAEAEETEARATESRSGSRRAEGSAIAIVEVENYTIEGGMIEAGKEIVVNLTLHNTASNVNANSIMMTLSNSTGVLYPVYGNDNQVYVGTISPNNTKTVSVPMTISSGYTGTDIDLTCQFDYETAGARMSNASTIVIPKSGGSTIGVKTIDVSSHAIVNGKSLLEFSYVNQSSSNVTDAKLIVDGNVSPASKEINIDTIYAGKSYTQDFYITYLEAGNQSVSISLVYTDVNGEEIVTDLGTFDVTVTKEDVKEATDNSLNFILLWVGRGVAAVVLVITIIAISRYVKKR